MKTLRILLKLFPTSFQNEMGEAWLEASETEIRQRQQHENKKFAVVVAFAMETLLTVLPQAYNVGVVLGNSPQSFVPQQNKTIAKSVDFTTNWGVFHCVGFIVAIHVAVASAYPNMFTVWVYGLVFVLLLIAASYKSIYRWWVQRDKPIVSVIGGTVFGFVSTFNLILLMFIPAEIETSVGNFAMYNELRKQMGYDSAQPTNEWFEQKGEDIQLRSERKEQWCELSRARLEGAATSLQSGDNGVSGSLLSGLVADTYAQGCWSNEDLYIAERHKIAAHSMSYTQMDNLFAAVDWVWTFKILKDSRNYMRVKSLYSPQKYCFEYTSKTYHYKTGKFVQSIELWNFCKNFPVDQSMKTDHARAIRVDSDKFVKKSMEAQ